MKTRRPLAFTMRRVLVLAVLVLAGCSAPSQPGPDVDFAHVHGLGYLAASDQVLVATHHGLVVGSRSGPSWAWDYAGLERYDYMGFTQDDAEPTTLYASGHPDDPRAYGGVHLGLRRSTDAGATWEQRSLKGQADFHALSAIPGVQGGLVGVWQDKLMESRDGGLTWTDHAGPSSSMLDVAVTTHRVYVAASQGLLGGDLGNASGWTRHADPEPGRVATAIAADASGSVLFAGTGDGRDGSTYRSLDSGLTWRRLDDARRRAAAVPAVFAFDPGDGQHVLAATSGGAVLESHDQGVTWVVLRRA